MTKISNTRNLNDRHVHQGLLRIRLIDFVVSGDQKFDKYSEDQEYDFVFGQDENDEDECVEDSFDDNEHLVDAQVKIFGLYMHACKKKML